MKEQVFRQIGTAKPGGIVAVCDHASNRVPEGVVLGIAPELLQKHIAWDIGAAGVTEELARAHGIPAHLAEVSRLVIDLHREEDSTGLIPEASDGHVIPGNLDADRGARIAQFHQPYHAALAEWLAAAKPALILSIHSFTPTLESAPHPRPWELGILYNQDDRAARLAIAGLAARGFTVGDNEPYSGRLLNATMNRHAEACGRPYLAIEIRNDLIGDATGQARWAAILAELAREATAELG
ncbi:N-formylglutamate amidohydrolase [Altererythrobacter sp. B11]|uniref:N-formylglutamate amidohydrolase n=1 Tax=Altererythrobacter sp. B11 TaxID=2060312 RepID=UPI000DC71C27|nr:N-formylglutamate amidohydrolase [Altererythrobacter sp. B11]BBC72960.1 N-formylglutamate amidohydrolase [Altererythrobacter sp. B11]